MDTSKRPPGNMRYRIEFDDGRRTPGRMTWHHASERIKRLGFKWCHERAGFFKGERSVKIIHVNGLEF